VLFLLVLTGSDTVLERCELILPFSTNNNNILSYGLIIIAGDV